MSPRRMRGRWKAASSSSGCHPSKPYDQLYQSGWKGSPSRMARPGARAAIVQRSTCRSRYQSGASAAGRENSSFTSGTTHAPAAARAEAAVVFPTALGPSRQTIGMAAGQVSQAVVASPARVPPGVRPTT